MWPRHYFLLWFAILLLYGVRGARAARRGGKGRGKGKTNLQFGKAAEFSQISPPQTDTRGARIVSGSHYSQIFKLGFKLVLICKAGGQPRPTIKWQKDGVEMAPKYNAHYYEKPSNDVIWSKLEIEPALMGDQGVYTCVANNQHGTMAKNIKAEYSLEH